MILTPECSAIIVLFAIAISSILSHAFEMYIRCTTIKSKQSGDPYTTYRLVESERINGKVKQRTLINLGRHFDVPKSKWSDLSSRISQLLTAQDTLFSAELTEELEGMAQRYAAQILAVRSVPSESTETFESVSVDSVELVRPRHVGVEQLALHALKQLHLEEKLKALGFNRHQLAGAIGNIVARMAFPTSELATHDWLQHRSGLGELIDYDFEGMGLHRLYQVSDLLWKHREALELHLYQQEVSLFNLNETITLYDLTNTFFEGEAKSNAKAKRGRSKEKRSDCPLVTLALVLDGSGFPRKSQIFSGNASEPQTLQEMLEGLNGRVGSTVVLDAGIATEDNIQWLLENGYHYLVVSRKRKRNFDEDKATIIKDCPGQTIKVQRHINEETGEIELYCHSLMREKKEQAIQDRFAERFEAALQSLTNGLQKKGTTKRYDKIVERIGRLKEKYAQAAQHYEIIVTPDPDSEKALTIAWTRLEKPHSQATHPGVYCLRTNLTDWDEETLWHTYVMLTDLESVFRSLKSELGLRPIYHHKEARVSGHIFISLLAYHLVHTLRCQLKSQDIHDSWQTLRAKMKNQQRVTVVLKREDGKMIHVRKATQAEAHQKEIYDALGISAQPGSIQKTLV
jgi:transposase